jgi:hypothetical protein
MDLNLSLTFQQQNDNKAIILTDTTDNWASDSGTNLVVGDDMVPGDFYEIVTQAGVDFSGGIGAPDNNPGTRFVGVGSTTLLAGDELKVVTPTIPEIDAATLDVIVTGVDEIATSKTQVDLLSEFGPFVTQDDLVYTITALLLGDTADTELVDGLYQLTYAISYSGDGVTYTKTDTLVVTILVYGQVKAATYEKLRGISTLYMCTDGCPSPEISEADLCGAYLSGLENSAFVAKTEELIAMLITLNNILTNGSKITW